MAIPAEAFLLDPNDEDTLQQQVQRLVTEGILSGRFAGGERLPSSRKLARHLGISRITVTIAYTELVANDYLTARGRSGYYVSDSAPRKPEFRLPKRRAQSEVDWSRALGQRFSDQRTVARPADWRRYPYPFIYGQADARLFDHHNWRNCALRALGQKDFDALTADYYQEDDPKLIEFLLRNILPRRGISANPDEILITMGAQNAIWLSAQVLLTQRRTAVLENPCYPVLSDILRQTRCNAIPVDVDEDGLPPEAIPDDADVVFATPSHHCPTNATMPMRRRRALLAQAAERGYVIVEDDYEFEISFGKSPTPALKALDETGAVIYVGSFSKSLFPGLRLGYLVASEPFIREARALRALVLRHPPGHIQRTAAYFLSLGYYDTQLNRMARAYAERRVVMEYAFAQHGIRPYGGKEFGGSSFWIRAGDGIDTDTLASVLREDGVLIEPGRAFFAPGSAESRYFRLAYSSIKAADIPEGIARLAARLTGYG